MNSGHLASAACAALILAACSVGKPIPQATTYIVEAQPAAQAAAARRPETLRMGSVRVAAPFAGSALVYRIDDVQFTSDPYQAFIADPAAMLASQMAIWLDRAGPFKAVAQPGSTRSAKSAPFVLEATITELYGDFRGGVAPAAVLTIQFALVDLSGPRPTTVYDRTIGRRVTVTQASPDALVRGYGTALAGILAELSAGLRDAGTIQGK
jgi:cholesterol transport system auxiliary component